MSKTQDPFAATSDPSLYVPRPATEAVLDQLAACAWNGDGVAALLGPSGVGKSLLLRVLARRAEAELHCVHVPVPTLDPEGIILWVASRLPGGRRLAGTEALLEVARERALLLFVEDAELLPEESARALGELHRASSGAIRAVLAVNAEELPKSLDEAFAGSCQCVVLSQPMTRDEVADYVTSRLAAASVPQSVAERFDAGAITQIYEASGGITSKVNAAARRHMPSAARSIAPHPPEPALWQDPFPTEAPVSDRDEESPVPVLIPPERAWWGIGAACAATFALGLFLGFWLRDRELYLLRDPAAAVPPVASDATTIPSESIPESIAPPASVAIADRAATAPEAPEPADPSPAIPSVAPDPEPAAAVVARAEAAPARPAASRRPQGPPPAPVAAIEAPRDPVRALTPEAPPLPTPSPSAAVTPPVAAPTPSASARPSTEPTTEAAVSAPAPATQTAAAEPEPIAAPAARLEPTAAASDPAPPPTETREPDPSQTQSEPAVAPLPPVEARFAAELGLSADPPAFVELDGQRAGVTPIRITGLRPGVHRLVAHFETGETLSREIVLSSGLNEFTLSGPMRRAPATGRCAGSDGDRPAASPIERYPPLTVRRQPDSRSAATARGVHVASVGARHEGPGVGGSARVDSLRAERFHEGKRSPLPVDAKHGDHRPAGAGREETAPVGAERHTERPRNAVLRRNRMALHEG